MLKFFSIALIFSVLTLFAVSVSVSAFSAEHKQILSALTNKNNNNNKNINTNLNSQHRLKVYTISDFHFDPYYGTPKAAVKYGSKSADCVQSGLPGYGTRFCDAPYSLVNSSVYDLFHEISKDEAADMSTNLILLLGDFDRHKMSDFENKQGTTHREKYQPQYDLEKEIISNITEIFANAAKDSIVSKTSTTNEKRRSSLILKQTHIIFHGNFIPSAGNNDFQPDYYMNITGSYHPSLINAAEALSNSGMLSSQEAANFSRCGYYSRVITESSDGSSLRIINLNTIIYSVSHGPRHQRDIIDPCDQFAWLRGELTKAATNPNGKQAVYIVGHIVPDCTKWDQVYLEAYHIIVMTFKDVIAAQFFAHTHMFNFLSMDKHKAPPLFVVPAITPVDGNVPNYIVGTLNGNYCAVNSTKKDVCKWGVYHMHQRYLNIGKSETNSEPWNWKSNSKIFGKDFGINGGLTTENMRKYGEDLLQVGKSHQKWIDFETFHFGGDLHSDVTMGNHDKNELLCRMINYHVEDYFACKQKYC